VVANPSLERLEDQIAWYDRKSGTNQRWYKALKLFQIVAGAMIPLTAGIGAPRLVIGALGVFIVVLEGVQSLSQFHWNWITFRSTCEALKHEKYLCLGKAGPYSSSGNRDTLFAERIESLVSREHAGWVTTHAQNDKARRSEAGG
jgi:hypothetical protein